MKKTSTVAKQSHKNLQGQATFRIKFCRSLELVLRAR